MSLTWLPTLLRRLRIVNDDAPQLGGTLDTNGQTITNSLASTIRMDKTLNAAGLQVNGVPVGSSTDTYWEADGGDIEYSGGAVVNDVAFVAPNINQLPATLELNCGLGIFNCTGKAALWDDIIIDGFALGAGASAPDLVNFLGAGNLKVHAFDGNATAEHLYGAFEMLHGWKEGTDIYVHLHWVPTTTNAGNVKWQFEYSWADFGGVFPAVTTIDVTTAAGGVAWNHKLSSFAAIPGSGKHIGSVLNFRLFRNPADGSDTYPDDAGVLSIGIHYQIDSDGSNQISTK